MAQGAQLLKPVFDTGTQKLIIGDGNDYQPLSIPPYTGEDASIVTAVSATVAGAQYSVIQSTDVKRVSLSAYLGRANPLAAAFLDADVVLIGPYTFRSKIPLEIPANKILIVDGGTIAWDLSEQNSYENAALLHVGANSVVHGLTVDVSAVTDKNSYGISAASGTIFFNVHVTGAQNTAWNLYQVSNIKLLFCSGRNSRVGLQANTTTSLLLHEFEASGNTGEGILTQADSSDIKIVSGNFSYNGDSGISLGPNTIGVDICGATCNNNSHQGIEAQSCQDVKYRNVTCCENTKNGILISNYDARPSFNHTVFSPVASKNGQGGLQIAGSSVVQVTGGTYNNNNQTNLGHNGVQIVVNEETNTPCYAVQVEGITATDTQATKTQAHGIYVSSGAHTYVRCSNSFVTGNASSGFVDSSTKTSGGNYTGQNHARLSEMPSVSSPSVPERYAYTYNLTGVVVEVTVSCPSGWVKAGIGGPGRSEVAVPNISSVGGKYTLQPGEYIYLDYTGTAPTWLWSPV